ncbi:putative delta DNA polymerase [Auricularia subglabra TFB-10046 SS5]|uniref:DNA polymerase n=1 Tax=Auricularia subglabra (strain TFB-10046 / SS5) TaxID=717982 RepID=J0LC87_AURST|nr:putative delta DNA polymerase [Auricularia subglabra TFB-10046 SS5]
MFGTTREGFSVLAHITDFLPYFYLPAPAGFVGEHLQPFQDNMNKKLGEVVSIEIVAKRTIWEYRGEDKTPFLKITVSHPASISRECNYQGFFPAGKLVTYESNVGYILRFMVDTHVVGMNWVTVPAGKYKLRTSQTRRSSCQIELDVRWDEFISHTPEGEWSAMAPLRILSFDIECAGRKGIFPDPQVDPVIQIASLVTKQGEDKPFIRNVFTLKSCSYIAGSDILSFNEEVELLSAWRNFLGTVDPDVIIGYNTTNFDLPYLLKRANARGVQGFNKLGRLLHIGTSVKEVHSSSRASGDRDSKECNINGRLQFDIFQYMQKEYKLRTYSLNAVSAKFLGEQKEDVHHSIISELQNGTPDSRRRLAIYCLKDAYLPQRLMDKLMCFVNYTEMARVTGVPFNFLLSRGQQIKVISQLMRRAKEDGYLIPAMKEQSSDDQYEGATVIPPTTGYYKDPIATLDFSSMYPSIMIAHNICYTTMINRATISRLRLVLDVDYKQTPQGTFFVNPTRRKGVLPIILEHLLSARKRVKADLKNETDPFKRAVLDGRQLALKISANSVYGFPGASFGHLPCTDISSTTTAYGREMIAKTKSVVEDHYRIENGFEHDARVIYGDTDSVMVDFGPSDVATCMRLGAEAAHLVTTHFVDPVKLEFEKVYWPYLLVNKKRYAGLYWTKPDKYDKLDAKGLESVRRDNCCLASETMDKVLNKMLVERDPEGALAYVKKIVNNLLQDRIDLSQLVITKTLAKMDYVSKQPHVESARRMKKRDAGSAPGIGDRVAYVIVRGTKNARVYDRAEDPSYVLEHNIPIDTEYYLNNQLATPLMRIFEPVLGARAQGLLFGNHANSMKIATPTEGGIVTYVVKKQRCLGCKTELNSRNMQNGAVCTNCASKTPDLYLKHTAATSKVQVAFSRLWTQCQHCQGSLHQDVLCSNRDCPIFYRRTKVQREVEDSVALLSRFDGVW